ncbi:hypothetical protein J31TS4_32460 [Paenibacillus sp. J31TS4]|uniref:copper amine oxidase N-terminal domain-containing protein n=1 Tax=Paenibacillus sp. J31TS4 TaxID=2807195 RepID=UPI001B0A251A|nr:copper amine oxidase N-terminal domain-containing protein [Paenibacillus sp. J31TS4]GIP39966.1 hypothetical protein J31TS4_32460 [Paenibacillus sp. J31TS4]
MKRNKFVLLLLGVLLLCGSALPASANQTSVGVDVYYAPLQYNFDGKKLQPEAGQEGMIYEGTTYVPLRFAAYALNKAVGWDQETYTVTLKAPTVLEKKQIEEYLVNRLVNGTKPAPAWDMVPTALQVYWEPIQYVVDGVDKTGVGKKLGFLYNDTLYVPIRFLSELLGMTIAWDQETFAIRATSAQLPKDETKPVETQPGGTKPGDSQTAPSPTPTPSNPGASSGPAGGGSSGGGSSSAGEGSKPSYDSLVGQTQANLQALQGRAEAEFHSLLSQFQSADSGKEKLGLMAQGQAMLSSYDSQVASLCSELEGKLLSSGYDPSVVEEIKAGYEQIKSQQMQQVLSSLSQ